MNDKQEKSHERKRKAAFEKLDKEAQQSKQITLHASIQRNGKAQLDAATADFFYNNAIPFSAVESSDFLNLIEAARSSKANPPSRKALSSTILDATYDTLKSNIQTTEKDMSYVTLQSDGWRDNHSRPLLNILFGTISKTFFHTSIDTSGTRKNASYLASVMLDNIFEYGPKKIFQVLTDNAKSCVNARTIIGEKYEHIFVSGCTSHALDLHLEDIAKLAFFKETLKIAKNITIFVRNHGIALATYRSLAPKDLIMCNETRFATEYLTAARVFEMKDYLEKLFVHDNVKTWLSHKENSKYRAS